MADRKDVEKISKTASGILDDAAQRTGDEKLRDALVILSESTKETLRQYKAHMSGGTVSEQEDSMYDARRYETASYFLTACPGISPFS
ncbi:hypothetical protein AUR04nite_27190 [Glutamicibacter uratoxydans]|uniref:Uncharacterized protein n=1 Tax=Glutamicibacter uratoxydans TaxID=43667 RepID=A0A4Y4DRD7_GLUUR|nr:hypothetical protein [Glutamicibacter uratoxydans]GED07187.1 hypothetical protein AUR04nite_27190 [Glutamicibacter uratoxydans]